MSSSSSVPLARQEEKKKEGDVKVKAPVDPPYKIFAIQKHTPSKVYHVFGKKFVFNYPISSLIALSFLFGWLDQNVLAKYGFMCTMQTANLIFLAINIYPNNNEYYAIETDSRLLVINFIFGSFGGCFLSLGLLEYTQNRTMTFAILMTILCAMVPYTHMLIHTYIQTYINTYIHTYIHTYIYTCIYTFIYIYMHIYILIYIYAHAYMCSYMHVHAYTFVFYSALW